MFNDRDLGLLGAGALLSVVCLLLPLPFAGKVALGFGVLVGFMVLAFMRLGPDRIPLEEWLRRRVRFRLQARRYTYQQKRTRRTRHKPWPLGGPAARGAAEGQPQPTLPIKFPMPYQAGALRPVALARNEAWVYPLATLLLGLVGAYVLAWLAEGGAAEIAALIAQGMP